MGKYKNTYCNPIKIEDYPKGYHGNPHRSLADPSVLYHDGKWYMYPSYEMAYVSEDFKTWNHVRISPNDLYWAPTIWVYKNKFYIMGRDPYMVYVGDNPLGPFEPIGELKYRNGEKLLAGDAMFFVDDDERVYLYWTIGPHSIMGVEMNPETMIDAISDPVELIHFNPEHEWEKFGARNQDNKVGWMEGSWMKKAGKRYFLIYSGCATQFGTYAMGAYYSDKGPLEGFIYQENSPICSEKHGLARGGGHGCVVDGPNDTMWIFYTIPVSYSNPYERMLGMDKIELDENGLLERVRITDTPQFCAACEDVKENGTDTGLYPLTVSMPTKASSYIEGRNPIYATDENLQTWWQPKDNDTEKSLTINLGGEYKVSSMRVIWRDVNIDYEKGILPGAFQYKISLSMDGETFQTVVDKSKNGEDYLIDYETFDETEAKYARLEILGSPKGISAGVIDFTVFGVRA